MQEQRLGGLTREEFDKIKAEFLRVFGVAPPARDTGRTATENLLREWGIKK